LASFASSPPVARALPWRVSLHPRILTSSTQAYRSASASSRPSLLVGCRVTLHHESGHTPVWTRGGGSISLIIMRLRNIPNGSELEPRRAVAGQAKPPLQRCLRCLKRFIGVPETGRRRPPKDRGAAGRERGQWSRAAGRRRRLGRPSTLGRPKSLSAAALPGPGRPRGGAQGPSGDGPRATLTGSPGSGCCSRHLSAARRAAAWRPDAHTDIAKS
jgi:hypothetical protein